MNDPTMLARRFGSLDEHHLRALGWSPSSPRRPLTLSLSPGSVHINVGLTNMLLAWENRAMIADAVLPVVPVTKRTDAIWQIPAATMQELNKTRMAGQRGMPNEVVYSVNSTTSYSVKDYGLIDFVPADVIANADAPLRPLEIAMRVMQNRHDLARELLVAQVAFGSANYGANTAALAGGDRWDTATSDPFAKLLAAKQACLAPPTHLVIGEQVWTALATNAAILNVFKSRASTLAGATPILGHDTDFLAKALGLEGVLVGRAKYATNNEGAALATDWIWGKSAALIRVEPAPSPQATQGFGYTFRFGPRLVQTIPELIRGVRGGEYVKNTYSEDLVATGGANAGYLLTTVIS